MKLRKTAGPMIAIAVGVVCLAQSSWADIWNQKTKITVNEALEIPGAILQPGKYTVKLADSQSNRHIVRFMNEDETKVIATALAVPDERLDVTGETKFSVYEMPAGQSPVLRSWFYPGSLIGHEFIYPAQRAKEIARLSGTQVPSMSNEANTYAKDTSDDEDYYSAYSRQEVQSYGSDGTSGSYDDVYSSPRSTRQPARRYGAETWTFSTPRRTASNNASARPENGTNGENTLMAQNRPSTTRPYDRSDSLPDTASNASWLAFAGLGLLLVGGIAFRYSTESR